MEKSMCGGLILDGVTLTTNHNGELQVIGLHNPVKIPVADAQGHVQAYLSINGDGNLAITARDMESSIVVTGVDTPVADNDIANKKYVDDAIANIGA